MSATRKFWTANRVAWALCFVGVMAVNLALDLSLWKHCALVLGISCISMAGQIWWDEA